MDKKTILGFVIMAAILFAFSWFNRPSQEYVEAQRRYQDSIASVQIQQQLAQQIAEKEAQTQLQSQEVSVEVSEDSIHLEELKKQYGDFYASAEGEEKYITIENERIEVTLTTKGGRVYSARLKEYTDYQKRPLMLFEGDESSFGVTLITTNNRILNTEDLYFESLKDNEGRTIMRLRAGENEYLDFIYYLAPDDYILQYEITSKGLSNILASNTNALDINWIQKIRQQEKGRKYEDQKTELMYKYSVDDVESLNASKDDSKNAANKVKWVGYKNQFFSTVFIADNDFEATKLQSTYIKTGNYLKTFATSTSIAFDPHQDKGQKFYFYYGPNDYALLKNYDKKEVFSGQDLQLEKLVPLGWSLFRYVNKWIIIPLFNFWTDLCGNIGLAIFLLTLTIKLLLFPLMYKSFMSSAKMRVMRPQVEEINKKYPKQEDAMVKQQKTMALYKQVGINPMSGCLPMLLQMPFLFALFMFFPSAIELRHQSFLWAEDLSTYDAIISWDAYIPLVTPYFGNHISLFCLLLSITNVIYTKFNMDQANTGQQQMPGMKLMMYIFPVFMLVFLNQFPAGLNYYYFISTLITILLTLSFRLFINEDKLLAKLEAKKGRPMKKKSGFMARLEEAQRQQQALAKQRAAQQRKGGKGR